MTVSTEQIELAIAKPTTSVIVVSSDMARRWLEHNHRNRPVSQTTVDRYRRDMEAGNWAYTADPIRFDVNGELLDGQHRLHALGLLTKISLPMLVVRGLPSESQLYMDQGRKRTAAQQLALVGRKNSHLTAAAVRLYIGRREGLLFRDNKHMQLITAADIQDWLAENESLAGTVARFINTAKSNDAPPSVGVCAAYLFAAIDAEQTERFFTSLHTGENLQAGNPILTLRNKLQRIRKHRIHTPHRDFLAMFIQAWNAFRMGKQMKVIPSPKGGGWTAATFPEPK